MYKLITKQGILEPYKYNTENEFEQEIVKNKTAIFGEKSIYFEIKKKIGNTIPDGYCLDLTFHTEPKLYFIEIEMESHDLYGHIAEQLLKFSMAFDDNKYKLKNILMEEIAKDSEKQKMLKNYVQDSKTKFSDETELLYHVIYEMPISIIVIIDEYTEQLERVQSKLNDEITVLEFESYKANGDIVHKFTPFYDDQEIDVDNEETADVDELDTIIVPAMEEGFNQVFLGENCWYAVRISAPMLNRIKYVAAYQVAPVSGVTYYASVDRIEKYKETGKYIIYFKDKAKKIDKIPMGNNKKPVRSCRYVNLQELLSAETISSIWE
ncbi:hypothetical protein NSA48_05235 [Frisingicoccus caecimuris]|uniref:Uncharacterized protein n=1 Tax=Frisingicoccus caecimuris TaxID=1796636 RepID=A0A4R2LE33_9FIRM|nr:hypothetical protein [Frisingicoccus caecimuris]MCR1918441.1 hypothetical protein [Frisingicoccus caecimuris]TCO85090.1 hypothetical protein EV212_104145 [Frisingicoccus caecimuris]